MMIKRMQKEEKVPDYRSRRKKRISLKGIGFIALYGAALAVILLIGRMQERNLPEEQVIYGTMDGRFTSDITMDFQGETLYYRENEIDNYLLIGMDRSGLTPGSYQDGGQADFLLVLSIDRRNRCITPVMIDRDTMAQVQTYGVFGDPAGMRTMQICLAQAFSGRDVKGSENTVKAVSQLLCGVEIDHYILMDLNGIILLNDAVGGIEVTLSDDLTALDPALRKGATVSLQGEMAEYFVRGRMTVADGTNASRMLRQQSYIDALVYKVRDQMQEDSDAAERIWSSLAGHVESDADEQRILSDINAYQAYEWKSMQMLPGIHAVGEDGFAEFWPDEDIMLQMIAEIWFS